MIWLGVSPEQGPDPTQSAAVPVTWGVAMLVPEMVLYPPPFQVERMHTPGPTVEVGHGRHREDLVVGGRDEPLEVRGAVPRCHHVGEAGCHRCAYRLVQRARPATSVGAA